ncbi:hypothetical protein NPIL_488561 [Nephila pilipes]|uniref:Uncharacterized protein n=1 Tax=Nephila pilipes TaxID=299642 RepID=A0A8X6NVB3_NEPPI|nr:hypothetical protein NPIL_488561 [Nephila pilipes]
MEVLILKKEAILYYLTVTIKLTIENSQNVLRGGYHLLGFVELQMLYDDAPRNPMDSHPIAENKSGEK